MVNHVREAGDQYHSTLTQLPPAVQRGFARVFGTTEQKFENIYAADFSLLASGVEYGLVRSRSLPRLRPDLLSPLEYLPHPRGLFYALSLTQVSSLVRGPTVGLPAERERAGVDLLDANAVAHRKAI